MPTLCSSRQPTIAVVTALYCEKQAVDAMMDNQETYVRYTTVGELEYIIIVFYSMGSPFKNLLRFSLTSVIRDTVLREGQHCTFIFINAGKRK